MEKYNHTFRNFKQQIQSMNSTKRKWNKHYNNNYNKTEKIEFKYKMTIVYNPPPPSSSSLLLLPPPPTPTDLIGTRRSFLYQCLCWLRYLKKKEEENCKTTHKKNWKKKVKQNDDIKEEDDEKEEEEEEEEEWMNM